MKNELCKDFKEYLKNIQVLQHCAFKQGVNVIFEKRFIYCPYCGDKL